MSTPTSAQECLRMSLPRTIKDALARASNASLCGNQAERDRMLQRAEYLRQRRKKPETNEKYNTFKVWAAIIQRCCNPNYPQYNDYGGRGITVCDRWRTSINFFADMGIRPSPSHTIERLDNDKGYSPDNCVWATRTQQSRNMRMRKTNTTGVTGISVQDGRYVASIGINGKAISLGSFSNLKDAAAARLEAQKKYGFSDTHGAPRREGDTVPTKAMAMAAGELH